MHLGCITHQHIKCCSYIQIYIPKLNTLNLPFFWFKLKIILKHSSLKGPAFVPEENGLQEGLKNQLLDLEQRIGGVWGWFQWPRDRGGGGGGGGDGCGGGRYVSIYIYIFAFVTHTYIYICICIYTCRFMYRYWWNKMEKIHDLKHDDDDGDDDDDDDEEGAGWSGYVCVWSPCFVFVPNSIWHTKVYMFSR